MFRDAWSRSVGLAEAPEIQGSRTVAHPVREAISLLHELIPRRSPEIAALRQYVGRKAQRGDTIRKHIGSMSPEAARGALVA